VEHGLLDNLYLRKGDVRGKKAEVYSIKKNRGRSLPLNRKYISGRGALEVNEKEGINDPCMIIYAGGGVKGEENKPEHMVSQMNNRGVWGTEVKLHDDRG